MGTAVALEVASASVNSLRLEQLGGGLPLGREAHTRSRVVVAFRQSSYYCRCTTTSVTLTLLKDPFALTEVQEPSPLVFNLSLSVKDAEEATRPLGVDALRFLMGDPPPVWSMPNMLRLAQFPL